MKKLYHNKAMVNALLSIQFHTKLSGNIDLAMTSNLYDGSEMDSSTSYLIDAPRHGKHAARFIREHATGNTLKWLRVFISTLNDELAAPTASPQQGGQK